MLAEETNEEEMSLGDRLKWVLPKMLFWNVGMVLAAASGLYYLVGEARPGGVERGYRLLVGVETMAVSLLVLSMWGFVGKGIGRSKEWWKGKGVWVVTACVSAVPLFGRGMEGIRVLLKGDLSEEGKCVVVGEEEIWVGGVARKRGWRVGVLVEADREGKERWRKYLECMGEIRDMKYIGEGRLVVCGWELGGGGGKRLVVAFVRGRKVQEVVSWGGTWRYEGVFVDACGGVIVCGGVVRKERGKVEPCVIAMEEDGYERWMRIYSEFQDVRVVGGVVGGEIAIVGERQDGKVFFFTLRKETGEVESAGEMEIASVGERVKIFSVASSGEGYVIAGSVCRRDGSWGMLIARVDGKGRVVWRREEGSREGEHTEGRDVVVDEGGRIIAVGSSDLDGAVRGDVFVVYMDREGKVTGRARWGGRYADGGEAVAVKGGKIFVAGWSERGCLGIRKRFLELWTADTFGGE